MAGPALAGDRYHYVPRYVPQGSYAAAAPAVPPAATVRIQRPAPAVEIVYSVAPAPRPAEENRPVYVDIRGPDGTVRTLPLEGGSDGLRSRDVIVRPGESVRIQLGVAARQK
jgi:hypothetical protein